MNEVYKPKRRLHRKMKMVCPEKLSSFNFFTDFSTQARTFSSYTQYVRRESSVLLHLTVAGVLLIV